MAATATAEEAPRRDREATRRRLLEALGRVLARDGFGSVGVNAVAKEAGVDKVLIYRYFGGLPELMRAFAEESSFWPSFEEFVGGDGARLAGAPAGERAATILANYLDGLRRRPLTQEIVAWELHEHNTLNVELDRHREATTMRLFDAFPDADQSEKARAMLAVIAAGLTMLVLKGRHGDECRKFVGIDIGCEQGMASIRDAAMALARAAFQAPQPS